MPLYIRRNIVSDPVLEKVKSAREEGFCDASLKGALDIIASLHQRLDRIEGKLDALSATFRRMK